MSEIKKIQKELYFVSVGRTKKSVILSSLPVTAAEQARVVKLKANKGSNKGDTTMMFGSKGATGYTALPNFGVKYFASLNTKDYKAADYPKVGDPSVWDVFVKETEDGVQEPFKAVHDPKTGKDLTNCFWAYVPTEQ